MDAARAVTQIRGGGQRDINGYLSTGDPLLDQQRHDQVWNNTFKTAQQRATRESEMLGIPYDQTFTARQMADQSSGKFFRPDAIGQARRDPLRDIPMGPAPVQYETLPFNQKAWEAKNPQMNAAIRNEVYDSFKLPNSGFSRRLPVRSRGVNPLAAFFGMFNR
jgi:hypothetical protein